MHILALESEVWGRASIYNRFASCHYNILLVFSLLLSRARYMYAVAGLLMLNWDMATGRDGMRESKGRGIWTKIPMPKRIHVALLLLSRFN